MRNSITSLASPLCVVALLCAPTTSGLAAETSPLPRDLSNLQHAFEHIPKDAAFSDAVWKVEALTIEEGKERRIAACARESIEAIESQGGVVTRIAAGVVTEKSRQVILRILTPRKDAHTFCKGFAYRPFTTKPRSTLSEDQVAARRESHRLSQCAHHVKMIFGGIFYAEPPMQMLEVRYRQGENERHLLQIVVPSQLDSRRAMSYRIMVR